MRRLIAVMASALVLTLGSVACNPHKDEPPVVDASLMAFLSEARALHHQANLKEDAGDLAGAADAMQRLVDAKRPGGSSPEIEEVLADAYARLAELDLKRNDLDAAASAIQSGLSHAPDSTYFRGHLVEIQGLVEESRSARLADAGDADAAAKSRAHAIQLLEDVVRIQDQVIRRSLADGGAE